MKTFSSFKALGLFLSLFVLVGAGCGTSLSEFSNADCKATPWASCINSDGVDSALTGQWVLESETISKNGQSFTTPLHGRVTTFSTRAVTEVTGDEGFIDERGTFSEDFNPETGVDTNVLGMQTTCDVIGNRVGDYFIDTSTDTPLDASGTAAIRDLVLWIQPTGGAQSLTCVADGSEVASTGTTTPLGNSFATSKGIPYRYEISADHQTLTLKNRNPVDVLITYVFKAQ